MLSYYYVLRLYVSDFIVPIKKDTHKDLKLKLLKFRKGKLGINKQHRSIMYK
jgi:hypothetical protein